MPSESFDRLVSILMVSFGSIMVLATFAGIVLLGVNLSKNIGGQAKKGTRTLCLIPTVAAFLVSTAGFVCNMGWFRIVMVMVLLPVWYTLLLVLSASASAPAMKRSAKLKIAYIVSHVCYVASGLVMPDFAGNAPEYVFFSLFRGSDGQIVIAIILFAVSIASMIFQIVIAGKYKKESEQAQ